MKEQASKVEHLDLQTSRRHNMVWVVNFRNHRYDVSESGMQFLGKNMARMTCFSLKNKRGAPCCTKTVFDDMRHGQNYWAQQCPKCLDL